MDESCSGKPKSRNFKMDFGSNSRFWNFGFPMQDSSIFKFSLRFVAVGLLGAVLGFSQLQTSAHVLDFPASGDSKAHDEFVQGVISLHSSSYDDAVSHFRNA